MREADSLLVEAGVQHPTVELEDVARFWPTPSAKGDIAYRNLTAIWANYSAAGAVDGRRLSQATARSTLGALIGDARARQNDLFKLALS